MCFGMQHFKVYDNIRSLYLLSGFTYLLDPTPILGSSHAIHFPRYLFLNQRIWSFYISLDLDFILTGTAESLKFSFLL